MLYIIYDIQQQMEGYRGIAEARRVLARLQLFKIAESLGGVESLVELPAVMTHASIPKQSARRRDSMTD